MLSLISCLSRHIVRPNTIQAFRSNRPQLFTTTVFKAAMASTSITINPPRDPNTLSNYNNWRTTHTTTEFEVLFKEGRLKGNVTHQLKSITDAETDEIILDSSYVAVHDVKVNGSKVHWELLPRTTHLGGPLKIKIDKGVPRDQVIDVSMDVATTAECTALQWMDPAQTSNKKHPYMFSQCQAIHARSVFPCQDTPDVKSTFDFLIKSDLPVVASGLPAEDNPTIGSATSESKVYKFHQKIPMPSYLYALASGDIVAASIGKHSVVVSGPDEVEACQRELEPSMDKFLDIAGKLIFPYVWGQYNVLVLPPSFPYGGMENPIYTFATPTIISGDGQNVDVIAHELAHSWSGNLVSNASWEHFWLNEGWTTYLERRFQAAIHDDFAYRDFSSVIGWKALEDAVTSFGADHNFTKMIPDLKTCDPDDAFSTVPYEKGFHFLWYLERLVGIAAFDKFIPHYFNTWQRRSLDSYDFKTTLLDFFAKDPSASAKLATVDWDTWFYQPGLPPKPAFDTRLVDVCYALADKWETIKDLSKAHFCPKPGDIKGWSANQVVVFLERVRDFSKPLSPEAAHEMGVTYSLVDTQNVEVSSRYFQVALRAGLHDIKPEVAQLLGRVGRMKFVRPLYKALARLDRDFAVSTFEKYTDFYHPICRAAVKKDLFGTQRSS